MQGDRQHSGGIEERAVSSVVSVSLAIVIVVALAAMAGILLLDVEEPNPNPPVAGFEVEANEDGTTTVSIVAIERLDSIRFTCDATERATGESLDETEWYDDPQVADVFVLECDRDDAGIVGAYDGEAATLL